MGAAASVDDTGVEGLAQMFERHHLKDMAEVVRAQNITMTQLRPVLNSHQALVSFFAQRNCDLGKPQADAILKLSATAGAGVGHGGLRDLDAKLEKLNGEMNSVSTYNDSQQVLQRWCREALAAGHVELALALIQKNSVLMAYMNDDVAIALSVEHVVAGQSQLAVQLLGIVKDDTKVTAALESKANEAVERDDKTLARALTAVIPDEDARARILKAIDTEDVTPQVREAMRRGDFAAGAAAAEKGQVPVHVVEELLEEAVLEATAAGDAAQVEAGLSQFPEERVAAVATRALGSCTEDNTGMFIVLLGYAVDKNFSEDEKVRVLTRVGCSQAKQLHTDIANYCKEELRKQLDPGHKKDGVEAPEALCCPITTQIMRQPVKTPAGHLYDRSAITQWVTKFHSDPMTRAPLDLAGLENDTETKARVDEWLAANATFLRGEKIVQNIFSIEWSFGVGWALAGEVDRVAANVKRVAGRGERHRLLAGLAVDVLKAGARGEHIHIAEQIAALAGTPIDLTVVTLDIATRTVKELEWTFDDWRRHLPSLEAQREVKPVALRFYFAAYAVQVGPQSQSSKEEVVRMGNKVAWRMPYTDLQKLRMQLETEYGMSNDNVLFPFKCDAAEGSS